MPIPRGTACTGGACDGAGRCTAGTLTTLPDDPMVYATALDPDGDFHDGIEFLYDGPHAVQAMPDTSVIDSERASVILGTVLGRDASGLIAPLPDVAVTIKGHPEYGGTVTRADGRYDLVVNGGGEFIVDFERAGYFPAQRVVEARWGDWSPTDDVVLIEPDPVSTFVTFGSGTSGVQVALSTPRNDGDGDREARVLFHGGTVATVTSGGQTTTPSSLTIRATEYTVNDLAGRASGRDMMPGALPGYSGYTYAVELSADEAIDAEEIQFSKPVFLYVDNFLDFNVGETVPTGYYDRNDAAWKASENGRIIRLIGESNGRAIVTLDDENNTPASQTTLDELGFTDAELTTLAAQYPSASVSTPVELWRSPITHFTPWDCNWGVRPPTCEEGGPCSGDPEGMMSSMDEPLSCGEQGGSIISCESRSLGESIPIAGTGYTLDYRSDRTRGYHAANSVRVWLPPKRPSRLIRFRVGGSYAGVKFSHPIDRSAPYVDLLFDSVDAYGRPLSAPDVARIGIGEEFEPIYVQTGGFAAVGDGPTAVLPLDWSINFANTARTLLATADFPDRVVGRSTGAADSTTDPLGGWSLSVHHRYEPLSGLLHMGNGRSVQVRKHGARLSDGVVASNTLFPARGLLALPDNSVLFTVVGNVSGMAPPTNKVVRAVQGTTGWEFTDVTATGAGTEAPDGTVASQGHLVSPHSTALGPDGSIYVTDPGAHKIRRIDPDNILHTVAGTGTKAYSADGSMAAGSPIADPEDIRVAKDGTVYFVDRHYSMAQQEQIRRITTDGRLETVVERYETISVDLEGTPTSFTFSSNFHLALDPEDRLVFGVHLGAGHDGVFRLNAIDDFELLAGGGYASEEEGGKAVGSTLNNLNAVDVDVDGHLLLSLPSNGRNAVFKVLNGEYRMVIGCASPPCGVVNDGASALAVIPNPSQAVALAGGDYAVLTDGGFGLVTVPKPVLNVDGDRYVIPDPQAATFYTFDLQGNHRGTYRAGTGDPIRTFEYDGADRLASITEHLADGVTETTIIGYDENGVPTAIAAPHDQLTALDYQASSADEDQLELRSVVGPGSDQPTWSMTYHTQPRQLNGRPANVRAKDDHVIGLEPQTSAGLMASFADPDGKSSTFTYTADGHLESDTNDEHGDVQRLTECQLSVGGGGDCACEPDPGTSNLTCKQPGRFVTHVRGDGATTKYWVQADASGSGEQRITETPDGTRSSVVLRDDTRLTSFPYNCDGSTCKRVTTTSTFEADPLWEPIGMYESSRKTVLPSGASLEIFTSRAATADVTTPYLAAIRTTSTSIGSGPSAPTYTQTYNRASGTVVSTTPEGRTTTVTLDSMELERVKQIEVPGLRPVEFYYDADGRLWKVVQKDAQGTVRRERTLAYHASGDQKGYLASSTSLVSSTQSLVNQFSRDAYGRTTSAMSPAGEITAIDWTAAGRVHTVTPPGKPAHTYAQNGFGATSSYTPPELVPSEPTPTVYNYTAGRLFNTEQQADGSIVQQTYDSQYRPDVLSFPGGSIAQTYFESKADCTGAGCFGGALKSALSSDNLLLEFQYDGFLPTKETVSGDVSASVSWSYDARFRAKAETLSYNSTTYPVEWAFDDDSLVTCVSLDDCDGTGSGRLLYAYDGGNGILESSVLDSLTETYGHTEFGDFASYEAKYSGASKYKVTYDDATSPRDGLGRVTRKTEVTSGGTFTEDYQYDANGRLHQVTRGSTDIVYTYDANGNRLKRTVDGVDVETASAADPQDRISNYGDFAYGYDIRGNLESKSSQSSQDTTRYEYNALGWLKKVSLQDGTIIEYQYDGRGRRTVKRINGTIDRRYIWNGDLTLAAEIDASGVVTRYAYGAKRVPELAKRSGVTYKVVSDQLGSIRMLINVSNGDVAFERRYDEYGRILAQAGAAGITSLGFAGGLYDADTDLVRFGVRDYDSYTGRWTAKDPIGLSGGLNVYEYCGGDPVNRVDPAGTFSIPIPWVGPVVVAGEVVALTWAFAVLWVHGKMNGRDLFLEMQREAIQDIVDWVFAKKVPVQGSGKEKATDVPSWARGHKPDVGQSGRDFAKELCDEKYGPDNYPKGPTSEFDKIKKWGDRAFKDP